DPLDHLGVDDPGADGVDPDTLVGVLEGGGLGEANDGVLGGGVGGLLGDADDAGAGGGVDDCAATVGEHERDLVLEADEDAARVDRHELVPVALGGVDDGGVALFDAGVVEGDVEPAVGRHDLVEGSLDGVPVGDVELDRQGGAAVGLDSFCDRVGSGRVKVGYGDRRASSGEGFCGGLTNAACGAGDEGDLAVNVWSVAVDP